MRLCLSKAVGALDLLLALLQGSPAQESLAVFLLEPGNLEVLHALLLRPGPCPCCLTESARYTQPIPGPIPDIH